MDQNQWMDKLREEGFEDLRVVSLEPGFMPGEHSHDQATVHVILKGELTITEKNGERVFKKGDRVDFPAGTMHSARFGQEGCQMIVGVKKQTI